MSHVYGLGRSKIMNFALITNYTHLIHVMMKENAMLFLCLLNVQSKLYKLTVCLPVERGSFVEMSFTLSYNPALPVKSEMRLDGDR